MSRLPPMSICLVASSSSCDTVWPLEPLATHLRSAGHLVDIASPGSTRRDASYDVAHCFGLATSVAFSRSHASVPMLVTPCVDEEAPDERALEPLLTGTASAVVRSSREQTLVHGLGVPWFRTWVVPVAVDVETFSRRGPMANRTDRFRLVTELADDGDGIATVLVALTRLDDVELVGVLAQELDPQQRTAKEEAVRSLASQLGVADRIAVVAPASAGELAWWLRSAHVAVAVPDRSGATEFVARAMACGRAVVASPVGALVDLVVHGVTGVHVPAGDTVTLARAVRRTLDDEFSTESFGMAGADRALSRFAWPRVANEMVGVYRRVAALDLTPDDVDEELEDGARDDSVVLALDDATIS